MADKIIVVLHDGAVEQIARRSNSTTARAISSWPASSARLR